MVKLYKTGRFIWGRGTAGNSVSVLDWDFVSKVAGVLVKTTAWVDIEWVAAGEQVFASNNETVAKAFLEYIKADDYSRYSMVINGWTITKADEGKYFDVNASQEVDGTTESATTGQIKMEEYISATKGIFSVVNK